MLTIDPDKTRDQLSKIKDALLSLKATGPDGFEGLIRVVLTTMTGIPFRLAASGLQGGMDGDAAHPGDFVSFEAKRYSGDIHRNEVITKIADIARNNNSADRLWVLGATSEISTQLAASIREDGDKNSISTLILDWTDFPLPVLAVALVAASKSAIDFLIQNRRPEPPDTVDRDQLENALEFISQHPAFPLLLSQLKAQLSSANLSLLRATAQNLEWREATSKSYSVARERLGQAIAVNGSLDLPKLRTSLREHAKSSLESAGSIVLLAGEGQGKSWLAAQICLEHDGITLFASAERFEGIAPKDVETILVTLLMEQTGQVSNDNHIRHRWHHRLKAWRIAHPTNSILLVVDGINQRESYRWDRILNSLKERLDEIGGLLIVTARPQYWHKNIKPGLTFTPTTVEVPEWSAAERDKLLLHYGVDPSSLDQATLQMLQNPRLLGVAAATLSATDLAAWTGLTPDRLLLEHLRASQREMFENETFLQLTNRLSEHAREVLGRARSSSAQPPLNFEADSQKVIETRFFHSLDGPGDSYELRDEGLTLALGYALVDQLWQAKRGQRELSQAIVHLIDPIQAMDRTTAVIFASLLVCALDAIRFDPGIFSSLLDAFSHLQNVSENRFGEFVEIGKLRPDELIDIVGRVSLERGRRINQDWLSQSVFEIVQTEKGWSAAESAIHRWLRSYNKNAAEQVNRFPKSNDAEDAKKLKKAEADIQETLASLSPYERDMFSGMKEVSGDTDPLFTLALRLLAGRPLAPFADSFVAMGLAFDLDSGIHSARKAFRQLTTFNRTDRDQARDAFLRAIEPLKAQKSSIAGQWTIVRMQHASDDGPSIKEANALAKELHTNWPQWEHPSPRQWRKVKAADPDAERPEDFDDGLSRFRAIDPATLLQSMSLGAEDYDFRLLLPLVCRFEPEMAVAKVRELLSGLKTRSGFPLRQLIFNGEYHIPLVERDLALDVQDRLATSEMAKLLPEREEDSLKMHLFMYVAPQLSAVEQLTASTLKLFGPTYLLDIIPSLKAQETTAIAAALESALASKDKEAAYAALVAALYGDIQPNAELEHQILKCLEFKSSSIKATCFQLAIELNLDEIRKVHLVSGWTHRSAEQKTYESWFGSMLLITACEKGEINIEALLQRISTDTWFSAAKHLGDVLGEPLATHFLQKLRNAVAASRHVQSPSIDITLSIPDAAPFAFYSLEETDRNSERFPKPKSPEEFFGADADFELKQTNLKSAAKAFFHSLSDSDARLLTHHISIDDLRTLVLARPELLAEIVNVMELATNTELVWLKNLLLATASLLSSQDPVKSITLFDRAQATSGFVTLSMGDGATLEHHAIWSSKDTPEMRRYWRQRLLRTGNDAELAREVRSAERFGAAEFIGAFVNEMISSKSSLDRAYAVCVAGYSSQVSEMEKYLLVAEDEVGLFKEATKSAIASHDAMRWTENWVQQMWAAPSVEEFWRCMMIAKTSMDARTATRPPGNTRWKEFGPVYRRIRKASIKDLDKIREKRFLGQEAPEKLFVSTSNA